MNASPPWDESKEPIVRAPLVVLASIGFIFALHLVTAIAGEPWRSELVSWLALNPERFAELAAGQLDFGAGASVLATLVTYTFLHDDFIHVLVNGLCFLAVATPVARRAGTARFLWFCAVCAICAALAHVLTHIGSAEPRMGLSGVGFGMVGALARFMFLDARDPAVWPRATQPLLRPNVLIWVAAWTASILVFGLVQQSTGAFTRFPDWEGHLGGFYAGLLLFPLFDRQRSWLR